MSKSTFPHQSVTPVRPFPSARPAGSTALAALRARLRGPGGLYNLGNVIALATGLALQLGAAVGDEGTSTLAMIRNYFFGSPGASWLTLAIGIFLVSGEVYHRAWQNGAPPDRGLNRIGDLLSFAGAVALTMSLVQFGDLWLALVSGTLLAGGKLGTAIRPESHAPARSNFWPALFRKAVVASRVPAMLALMAELSALPTGSAASDIVAPAIMLLCYVIWTRADFLLMASDAKA